MKTIKMMLAAVLITAVGFGAQAQDKKQDRKGTVEITFSVNLHCDHCKKKIESNIPFEKGVTDLKVDLDNKQVYIKYDAKKTDREKLQKAIEKLGYTAAEVTPGTKGKAKDKVKD
ncbi:MAG: heavy-metal-associated domain-containing protein [Prevotellaceae bacterium]|jgi:copper chaperone CopZ|nr:heavy-metal-associated domain-containing protein [Prevotellaceae bacterium]